MLGDNDEILLEQFISFNNMTIDSRDICINLIRNIKEIECSEFLAHKYDGRKYKLVQMSLSNIDGRIIKFNGFAMNENEVRHLKGEIQRKGNKYFVITDFYRSNEYVDDDDNNLSTFDIFTIKEDNVIRKTHYKNYPYVFETILEPFDDMELYDYYYEMIYPNQKKLENTNN